MANVLLGVTGSVAAINTGLLFDELRQAGHAVKVVATAASLYFFDPASLDPIRTDASPARNPDVVILDEDEWPGRDEGRVYRRNDKVVHIELRRWADVLMLAPLDANTLAKLACGLADNCLTCVYRAWDRSRPIVLAPAMNTLMWENPITSRHLRILAEDAAGKPPPSSLPLPELVAWINEHCQRLSIVAPISKRLACDEVGIGALADREQILAAIKRSPAACG
jgi:phosphopantothenoylcysteine decarboxylase